MGPALMAASRLVIALLAACSAVGIVGIVPAAGDLVSRPSIEGESIAQVAPGDATLEATINPNGLETNYEFHLVTAPPCASGECPQHVIALPSSKLAPSSTGQSVSLNLNSVGVNLSPNERYEYWVTATNVGGTLEGQHQQFTALASHAPAPSIANESESTITSTDATLEATINPNGLETNYEFHLVTAPPCASGECPQHVIALPSSKLAPSSTGQSVSLNLNSVGVNLSPNERYEYWVTATNVGGTLEGQHQQFTTVPEPSGPTLSSPITPIVSAVFAPLNVQASTLSATVGHPRSHVVSRSRKCLRHWKHKHRQCGARRASSKQHAHR